MAIRGDRGHDALPPERGTSLQSFTPTDDRGVALGYPGAHGEGSGSPSGGGADLAAYLRILRRQWWLVFGAFVLVTGSVAVTSLTRPKVYRATATVEIRRQSAEVVPVESFSQFERISDQYLETQYEMLRGRALVREVVSQPVMMARLRQATARPGAMSRLKAALGVGGSEEPEPGATELERRTLKLTSFVRGRLTVDPVTGSRIVRVSLEMENPKLAADLVNEILNAYLEMRQDAGLTTLARLAEQADSVRTHLLAAETSLQDFVRENGLGSVLGGAGETVPQERLRRLQQELTGAEADAYRAEALSSAAQTATPVGDSDLLMTLRERRAELQAQYARLRSTFTDSFPRTRQVKTELVQLDSLLVLEERRVASTMAGQHQAALRRRNLLQRAVQEQRQLLDSLAGKVAEYERLRRDLDGQEQLYASLQQKRKEAAISAALSAMDVAVLDHAAPPLSPVRPTPKRDIPLGALAGLALGLGLAFVRHYADSSVRTMEDVQGLAHAPVLAMIPATPHMGRQARLTNGSRERQEWHRIDRPAGPFSALDEAFSGLRTSMLYDTVGPEKRTLLVTSSQPGEGKTTVSTNLAISLARLGRRVLLIDADIRRPSLHRVFSLGSSEGLSEYLEGDVDWRDVVRHAVAPGLDALPAGAEQRNPADQLSSERAIELLVEAEQAYDYVMLDAPALFINAPDARILSHMVDGVILVVRSGVATREVVQRLLGQVDNLMGLVLNEMDLRSLPAYYRDYGADRAARAAAGTHASASDARPRGSGGAAVRGEMFR